MWGSCPLCQACPKQGGDSPSSLPTDKCITSELLKDIPLPGVLGGSLSAEAELLKGGESWARGRGGCLLVTSPTTDTVPLSPLPTGPLPSPKELINGNIKTITEYREEEDGRKVKVSSVSQGAILASACC